MDLSQEPAKRVPFIEELWRIVRHVNGDGVVVCARRVWDVVFV
jgi:hypothetical protein